VIDISMVESMSRFLSCRISSYLGSGEVPRRSGGKDSVIAIYQTFETADELITLGLGSDAIWKRFWAAVGEPDYAEQPGVTSNSERRAQRARIVGDIQKVLAKRPRSEWLELFASARVPAGPINRVDEVAADPHLQDRGFLFTLDDDGRRTPHIGLGIRFDGEASVPRAAPPKLGADTDDVLNSLDDDQ